MKWITSWSYLPINYNTSIGTIENITQRTFFWNNVNGEKVKIKFSNLYSMKPLILDKVLIAKKEKGEKRITNEVLVTSYGNEKIVIGPGEEFYSDEITFQISAGSEIVLSVYVKEKTDIYSASSTWAAKSWHTVYGLDGDYTKEQQFHELKSEEIYPYVKADVNKANIIFGVSAIKVYTAEKIKTVCLFGDSITHMSYFSDALLAQIYDRYPGKVTVINRGIGGNRILNDATECKEFPGGGKCFGKAAVTRFEQDVYGEDNPETVIILEGVNDLMHPYIFGNPKEIVSAEELINGIMQMAAIAHRKESKVYLGTIMPFLDERMSLPSETEAVRNEVNAWILHQEIADGIVDFSNVIADPEDVLHMRRDLHIGDFLHPNTEGGIVMANTVLQKDIIF